MNRSRVTFVAGVVLSIVSVTAAAQAQYRFVHLGTLAPPSSYPTAINNRNQVVGASTVPGDASLFHGFLWENGRLTDLGTWPGGFHSEARDINDRGQIVGMAFDEVFRTHAVIWEDGRMRELASPPGAVAVSATDINDAGVITLVGFDSQFGGERAFRIERRTLTVLPPAPGYSSSVALRLNERGDAVGYSYSPGDPPGNPPPNEGTVWHGTQPIAVGFPPGTRASSGRGINARGVVVGGGFADNVGSLPFLWANGTMHLLPIPPGRVGAYAAAINDRGVIAGVASLPEGDTFAVLWVPDPSGGGDADQ
jgi:probable HAF family extracellular repeat protein